MNFLIAFALGLPVGLAAWLLTRRLSAQSRAMVAIGLASAATLGIWIYRVIEYPHMESGERPSVFALVVYLGSLALVAGLASALVNACRDRITGIVAAILGLILFAFVASKGFPKPATPQPSSPAAQASIP